MHKLVRFSFFCKATSINKITDFENLEDVEKVGFVSAADKYIQEIKDSIGFDVKELAQPQDYLHCCSFIELVYNHENDEVTEKRRLKLR